MSTATQSISIRPTKKQREILSFIESFIGEHGYSPSYREIMKGLSYTSVATVSLHVNSLIRRGHLRKRDRSARSLEVVRNASDAALVKSVPESGAFWLLDKVEAYFTSAERAKGVSKNTFEELAILVRTLGIVGLNEASDRFELRLSVLAGRKYA